MATLWKDENKGKTYRMLCGAYASVISGRTILLVGETEVVARQFREAVLAKTTSPEKYVGRVVTACVANYSTTMKSNGIDEVFIDHAAIDSALTEALDLEG